MATYAPVPAFAERKRHPRALLFIIAGHAALLTVVMAVKMDMPQRFDPTKTMVDLVPLPQDPPPQPVPPEPRKNVEPKQSSFDMPTPVIPIPSPGPVVEPQPVPVRDVGPVIGPGTQPSIDPLPLAKPTPAPVRTGPRFATPDHALRPPYPPEKARLGDEAALRLRLTIDERGRVTAVEPVGDADRAFLAAARKHLIAKWRYKPAMEGGRPVPSSTVITLRFQLDD